jgi:dolichol-phosphate mannosyltransferase
MMTSLIEISFIVPAFNEEENVAATMVEIERARLAAGIQDFEIIAINDASSDNTLAVLKQLAEVHPCIRLLNNEQNLGLGGTYKRGVKEACGTFVMMVPGDNEHPAEGILSILKMRGAADLVIPYVTNTNVRPLHRRIISRAFVTLMNTLFWLKVPYYNGLVIHRTELLKSITIESDGFAFQAEAVIKLLKRGCSFVTVGTILHAKHDNNTKAFRISNVLNVVWTLIDLRRRIAQSA